MTVKKIAVSITTEKEFTKALNVLATQADSFADSIHKAGLYVIEQVNKYDNPNPAQRLIDAMGKKHDKKRVQQWLVFFGKLTVKEGLMVFKKRKDIAPENVEAWSFRAAETPYWELNKQAGLKVTFDYLSLVNSIIKMHDEKVQKLIKAGKTVTENNVELLDRLKKLVKGYTPVIETK